MPVKTAALPCTVVSVWNFVLVNSACSTPSTVKLSTAILVIPASPTITFCAVTAKSAPVSVVILPVITAFSPTTIVLASAPLLKFASRSCIFLPLRPICRPAVKLPVTKSLSVPVRLISPLAVVILAVTARFLVVRAMSSSPCKSPSFSVMLSVPLTVSVL